MKNVKFGIVTWENGQQMITCYDNATNIKTFAIEHLKSVMESEGYQVNDLKGYLNGWLESINECRDGEGETDDVSEVIGEIADNLTYTNTHFVIAMNGTDWAQMNSTNQGKFFDAMDAVLTNGFGDDKQVAFINAIKGTQFEKDLTKNLKINGANSTKAHWNLIVSIRDCKLWANIGMKPTASWKVTDVKKYFGIKGKKETLAPQLEIYKSILLND